MPIYCLGLNHTGTPISLLERLTFSDETIRASLTPQQGLRDGRSECEVVIVSTCSRIEVYSAGQRADFERLATFLAEARGVPVGEIQPHAYRYSDARAVHHLLEVASGLDSLVVGEPQILGQVTRAFELARELGAAGPLLSRLFQAAIHAGKRAHAETSISRNPVSISSLAAGLAGRMVRELAAAQIVILGVGEMAELAVEALRKRGAQRILVVNRSLERAQLLAGRWSAETTTFQEIHAAVTRADVLIASTGAPHFLVDRPLVAGAMQARPDRPLLLIDIAMPRNIDPAAGDVPQVQLFDLDALKTQLETSLDARSQELPHVRAILAEEEARFLVFLQALDVLPLIADLRRQADAIRRAELEKTLRRMPELNESERARIEAMTLALVKKLLDAPTRQLRSVTGGAQAHDTIALSRALFGLAGDAQPVDEAYIMAPTPGD